MELQPHTAKHHMAFALLGAVESSVSNPYRDVSLVGSNSSFWHQTKEIGATQMTPLAESFQTLYKALELVGYSHESESSAPSMNSVGGEVNRESLVGELEAEVHQTMTIAARTLPGEAFSSQAPLFSEQLEEVSQERLLGVTSSPELSKGSVDVASELDTMVDASKSNVDKGFYAAYQPVLLPISSENNGPLNSVPPLEEKARLSQLAQGIRTVLEAGLNNHVSYAASNQERHASSQSYFWDSLSNQMTVSSDLLRRFSSDKELNLSTSENKLEFFYVSSMVSATPNILKLSESFKPLIGTTMASYIQTSSSTLPSIEPLTHTDVKMSGVSSQSLYISKAELLLSPDTQRQIHQVLKDKVQLQLDMNNKVARIRFDPPELGRVEMVLRIEGDKLSLQMSATSLTTREALIATSERLRHELVAQNSALSEVNITLSEQKHAQYSKQHSHPTQLIEAEENEEQTEVAIPEYTAYIVRV
ncbi:flagellar hook-length control protein FliK [Vibrio maritimus]|uniref:flagellar hook-length control protein FliK n=1 Tax=Vibrio maritimus TaxID=990268 RepID=UPI003734C780